MSLHFVINKLCNCYILNDFNYQGVLKVIALILKPNKKLLIVYEFSFSVFLREKNVEQRGQKKKKKSQQHFLSIKEIELVFKCKFSQGSLGQLE